MGKLGPRRLVDVGLRQGPWRLSIGKLEKAPHGIDLGPLTPCLPGRLKTGNRRIDLAPEILVRDVERLRARADELSSAAPSSMVMIGRRDVRSNNSWMHNSERLMRGKDRCTLLMHPEDAERLGVAAAPRVIVSSRVGSITAPLELTDTIMPGVVSLPHGWGHGRSGVRLATALSRPGVSLNDITDPARIDVLSGNASVNGVPVTIEPAAAG